MSDGTITRQVPLNNVIHEFFSETPEGERIFALPDDLFQMFMRLYNDNKTDAELYELLSDTDIYDAPWEEARPCVVCHNVQYHIAIDQLVFCSYICARSIMPEHVVHTLMDANSKTSQWNRFTYVNVMRVNIHLCVRESERMEALQKELKDAGER